MEIREYGNEASDIVLIQMTAEHENETIKREFSLIREMTDRDFLLRTYKVNNWNNDLSPWEAPSVFGNERFGGGAAGTLSEVIKDLRGESTLTGTVKDTGNAEKTYIIGGYSLAGLFALWSAYETDMFKGVAAASPSVWFPGFSDFMGERKIMAECVYLSLGDREAKARNPVMATVGERIVKARDILAAQSVNCRFEWNEGNHFKDADLRTAKAFAWVINSL